jgi:hypothetical protein
VGYVYFVHGHLHTHRFPISPFSEVYSTSKLYLFFSILKICLNLDIFDKKRSAISKNLFKSEICVADRKDTLVVEIKDDSHKQTNQYSV